MYTSGDVKRLIQTSHLPEFEDKNLLYSLLTKHERLEIIRSRSRSSEDREIAGAVEIQRRWRGYRIRNCLYLIFYRAHSPVTYNNGSCSGGGHSPVTYNNGSCSGGGHSPVTYNNGSCSGGGSMVSSNYPSTSPSPTFLDHTLPQNISNCEFKYLQYSKEVLENNKKSSNEPKKLLTFQAFCVNKIQRWWRRVRRDLKEESSNELCHQQQNEEENEDGGAAVKEKTSKHNASIAIQKAWRAYVDRRVFKYYKNLIGFRFKGDPHLMLRCINPKEAHLLDNAKDVHIRFRLGGVKFPPHIYYKIYTNLNIADICSFSPRDYMQPSAKSVPGKFVHNKNIDLNSSEDDKQGWYKRFENNGWRRMNQRLLHSGCQDPIVYETSQKKKDFAYSKLTRKQDVMKKRKQKKIDWMRNLYMGGGLHAKGDDSTVQQLVEDAAEGMLQADPDTVDDWEVDELLHWTNGLNFQEYIEDWHSQGTTSLNVKALTQLDKINNR